MKSPYEENRVRLYYIDARELLAYLNHARQWPQCLIFPHFPGLPEGATLLRVFNDDCRRALGVLVAHESFPVVPDGAEPSREPGYLTIVRVVLERLPDGSYREPAGHGQGLEHARGPSLLARCFADWSVQPDWEKIALRYGLPAPILEPLKEPMQPSISAASTIGHPQHEAPEVTIEDLPEELRPKPSSIPVTDGIGGRVIGHAQIVADKAFIEVAKDATAIRDETPQEQAKRQESSREWFQRIMSQDE